MDPATKAQLITAVVFCLAYLYIIIRSRHMAAALWVGVAVLVALTLLLGLDPIIKAADLFGLDERNSWRSINWNVMGIFVGTLLLAQVFIYSRVPSVLSDWLIDRSPNVCWAILGVCAVSSFISVFAANVATVLIVAPIAIELARKLKVSPAPFLIGIAIASNLQGTATLIGDPPSMLLADRYQMNFNDFFWHHGRPGIFFAVQVGAIASFVVLWFMFRRYRQPVVRMEVPKPLSWVPTVIMAVMVVGLAMGSSVDKNFLWFGGVVCVACGLAALGWLYRRDRQSAAGILKSYDWGTTLFLMGVFMMVYAMTATGLVDIAATWVSGVTDGSVLLAFVLVVGFSMVLSAFVDNIPYIAAMLPLVERMGASFSASGGGVNERMLLAYGLLIGSCLGGNITPIGASANVVAYGMLRKLGEKPTFMDFVKIGLPFTLAATAAAAAFVWIIFMWM